MSDTSKKDRWDQRYRGSEYVFGTEPNDFLKDIAPQIPPASKVLCLADGEGRNGVYLASLGHDVTSIDQSKIGLEKARLLAENRGVSLNTVVADLTRYEFGIDRWDAIVSIFFHIPSAPRNQIYARVTQALKPDGGLMILESYTPAQLEFGTGGPPTADLMMTRESARACFPDLSFDRCAELERDVIEGTGHTGRAAVLQVIARKQN